MSMQILVNNIAGKTITFNVEPNTPIDTAHQLIQDKEGIPPEHQRIVFAGKQLERGKTLACYNIQNAAFLHLMMRQRSNGHT